MMRRSIAVTLVDFGSPAASRWWAFHRIASRPDQVKLCELGQRNQRGLVMTESGMSIGIDLGGTKIEGAVLDREARVRVRQRVATPSADYPATLRAIRDLVQSLETRIGPGQLPVGICTPGAASPFTGLHRNANSACLNGKALQRDLENLLRRPLRLANDADCLALSEAADGAGAKAGTVFAAILGTGVGGGIVSRGLLLRGPNAIAGEWGHAPLPWIQSGELGRNHCWCGHDDCIETWLSGPGLSADHRRSGGQDCSAEDIAAQAAAGSVAARASLTRYADRLARSLALIINILDPEVIVLGGGVSGIGLWYETVPHLWAQWVFSDQVNTRLVPAQYGDSSGVRGAAWLWSMPT